MSDERILILIPHPDDEVAGCAAAIGRARDAGAALFGLYLTTGVPAPETLWPWQRRRHAELVERRRGEAREAAALLGIEPLAFAERPARQLKSFLGEAVAEIRAARLQCHATRIWVPAWEGGHQDHDVANFLAAQIARDVPVTEFAEYNYAGGAVRSQSFPALRGDETVLRLSALETTQKRRLLARYRSEARNLTHIGTAVEMLRPLGPYDYRAPPHQGTLFRERFHWVPFRHPRVDFDSSADILAALARFDGAAAAGAPLPLTAGAA